MTQEEYKERLLTNRFVDRIQQEMRVDAAAYHELCLLLRALAVELKPRQLIDKELAYALYRIPLVTRNTLESLLRRLSPTEVCVQMEGAWLELDALVAHCFSYGP